MPEERTLEEIVSDLSERLESMDSKLSSFEQHEEQKEEQHEEHHEEQPKKDPFVEWLEGE